MNVHEAYMKAGGPDLAESIMDRKVKDGSTFITRIHHRQTPLRIVQGESDAGPVWATEVLYQQQRGQPITGVPIPDHENVAATSLAGIMADAPRLRAAEDFLKFIGGARARLIYRTYGFRPPP